MRIIAMIAMVAIAWLGILLLISTGGLRHK
jgi:hypothetical protein